jgi:hypothetical protein
VVGASVARWGVSRTVRAIGSRCAGLAVAGLTDDGDVERRWNISEGLASREVLGSLGENRVRSA